jgi:hypothetical protein
MRSAQLLAFLLLLPRAASGDEIHTKWPVPPSESKPKEPSAEPPPPKVEEKPKEVPKPPPPKTTPKPPPPPAEDPVEDCISGCDVLRAEGLRACKDESSLPPPKDCRDNISNAAAECIHVCRGY